jgi:hypothetical protein
MGHGERHFLRPNRRRNVTAQISRAQTTVSSIVGIKHRADGRHGNVEAARDLAIGRLEAAGAGGLSIKIGRKLGAIGAECLYLRGELVLAAIIFASPFDRRFQGVERRNQPGGGGFDRAGTIILARDVCARRDVLQTVWIRHLTQDLAQARSRHPLPTG